jgi:hypothetical protein
MDLGQLRLGILSRRIRRRRHTLPQVVVKQTQRHLMKSPTGRGKLGEDAAAVPIFVNHVGDAPDLALDPGQTRQVGMLVGGILGPRGRLSRVGTGGHDAFLTESASSRRQ